jgi:hypothetical protein
MILPGALTSAFFALPLSVSVELKWAFNLDGHRRPCVLA